MSIKKTWFSYILWLLATGFSVLFTYAYIEGIIGCYGFERLDNSYGYIGFSAGFIFCVAVVYFLFNLLRKSVKAVSISKWGGRCLHILILCGVLAMFVITRYRVLFSTTLENIMPMHIFEAAKVMQGNGQAASYEVLHVFEEIYINVLSGLFLFFGNKMEIMLYFQIFLQALSLLLLLFIGRMLQKGFLGFVPAVVYTLSQFCMDTVVCLSADNFWFFITVLVIAFICILEKAWKNKVVTYILLTLTGIVFSVLSAIDSYPHAGDLNKAFEFWFYERLTLGGAEGFFGFLILIALMGFFCISFWKTKTDNASAYILPVTAFTVIIYFNLDAGIMNAIFMLIRIYMSFMAAEGLRILFETEKVQNLETEQVEIDEAVTESETTEATLSEINDLPVSEDTGIIRVSDILKASNANEGENTEEESVLPEEPVDRTAPIENVLPMPKKHVARTFEYAFEPTEDMMHYDVEIENDDYDFE